MAEKKETREMLENKAKALFDGNKELTEVHLCANGQGFTDKEYAERYAKQFSDDNVYTFIHDERVKAKEEAEKKAKKEAKKQATLELASKQGAFDYENVDKALLSDKDFLLARYELLAEKKPPHNIGIEKLAEQVAEFEKTKFNPQNEE